MMILGEIFLFFTYFCNKTKGSSKVGDDVEMEDMSNSEKDTSEIYHSHIINEYENDVPQPLASSSSNTGLLDE